MIKREPIIRISLLLLMVLLGLTAVAPEWLELKDLYIEEQRLPYGESVPDSSYKNGLSYKALLIINDIKSAPENVLSFIHKTILGSISDVKSESYFGAIFVRFFRLFATIGLYVFFLTFTYFLFLAIKQFSNYINQRYYFLFNYQAYPLFFNFASSVIAISLALLIWPIILMVLEFCLRLAL